jgi:hypothetical protein
MSLAEIKAQIQKLTPAERKELHDALEAAVSEQANDRKTGSDFDAEAKPIWKVAEEIGRSVPSADWEKVPKDGSINLDHYLYGHPKVR